MARRKLPSEIFAAWERIVFAHPDPRVRRSPEAGCFEPGGLTYGELLQLLEWARR